MYAARISEFHIQVRRGVGVYPSRKAVILRDVGTACRLLVLLEDSPVRARLATARDLAEDGLPREVATEQDRQCQRLGLTGWSN